MNDDKTSVEVVLDVLAKHGMNHQQACRVVFDMQKHGVEFRATEEMKRVSAIGIVGESNGNEEAEA